ncbi:MAG TPA: hypothetical protein VF246_06065 [Acidimicrobiia bacterium]
MESSIPAIVLTVVILSLVIWWLFRARERNARLLEEGPKTAFEAGLSTRSPIFTTESGSRAPVAEFAVRGGAMHVTFDVPLPEERDEILEELLVSEAVEVVREKRHTLPLGDLEEIVVHAGRGDGVRQVGRVTLPARGELPPPAPVAGIDLRHVAHDPFAAPFEDEDQPPVPVDVRVDVPADELPPIGRELRIPKGLERGLRALGLEPDKVDGAELLLGLLRMFGYTVTEQALPGSYLAIKDGQSTYVYADTHEPGEAPEVEDSVIRRFLADFTTSGADRGMLLSEKYAPYSIHEIESRQPKVRFVTRERIQRFIDGMALG